MTMGGIYKMRAMRAGPLFFGLLFFAGCNMHALPLPDDFISDGGVTPGHSDMARSDMSKGGMRDLATPPDLANPNNNGGSPDLLPMRVACLGLEGFQPGSPWPTWRGCASRQGRAVTSGPQAPNLKWMATVANAADDPQPAEPIIAADGTLYLTVNSGRVQSFAPDGTLGWFYDAGGQVMSPTLGPDGTLYVGGLDPAVLLALDNHGNLLWKRTDLLAVGSVLLDGSGVLYVGGQEAATPSELIAVDTTGSPIWRVVSHFGAVSAAALGPAGDIYFAESSGTLAAAAPDGTQEWARAPMPAGNPTAAPSIGDDGTIYITATHKEVAAFGSDGSQRWLVDGVEQLYDNPPALGPDGTLYIAEAGMTAVSPDGKIQWRFSVQNELMSAATVGADGIIYVGSREASQKGPGILRAISPDGTLLWKFDDHVAFGAPVLGSDGTLYVAGGGGRLYAFSP
jgi:outer membrane protein assembly factor BamB